MGEKIVLIGAGSSMFTRGLVSDLISRGKKVELCLVDINSESLSIAEKLVKKMIACKKAPIKLSASMERRKVLPGATTVICTIGVGGRRAWELDVLIPRKYGIYQAIGDTVMPGGTSRALRMVPAMVGIAEDILYLAPDALFFNYGNPMAIVCRAIRKATGANVVGLCHGINHVGRYLAGILGAEPDRIRYTALGMNHLTWFVEVRVNGKDMMPELKKIALKKQERISGAGTEDRFKPVTDDANPFCWHLLTLFGGFPAPFDCHVSEFFPQFFAVGDYYGRRLGVEAYRFEDTIAYGDRIFEEMKKDALSKKTLDKAFFKDIGGEQEQVVEIIDSIRNDCGRIYSANLPNTGQAPNLPANAIIECPAIADAGGLRAITQAPLPSGIAGTLAGRLAWVETTVEAALEGSREKFAQALVLDGYVNSIETAERLADELLAAHKQYLPQFRNNKI